MFDNSSTINFGCTSCGKCCDKPPVMTFYDIFNLSNDFFIQTAHNASISYEKKPLDKSLLQHYQAIGHTIMMPEIEASLFYFINFIPVEYSRYKTCSKLIDNKCSIYNNRPSACKISPLNLALDDSEQWNSINIYKKNTLEKDWKCDFSDKSPILISNGQIYNNHYNSVYFQSVDTIREFTDNYIEFISLTEDTYKDNHFKALFKTVTSGNLMITDMIISLQVARFKNIISEELAYEFLENQLKFIEKESKFSLSMKIKDDLHISRLYKRQKEDYIRALNSKIFSSDENIHF